MTQKGALLTSAAGIVRYYQNHGDLPGATDPGGLNQFLQNLSDGFLSNPDIGEQVVYLVTGEFREFSDASHPA